MPLLYYCEKDMREHLMRKNQSFVCGDSTETHPKVLRCLDIKAAGSDFYTLVVTNDPKSMRGHDYRAPLTGIT
jgi:hypothetical protein